MSPPPGAGAGGVGLGVPIPHAHARGLPFPLPISGLPRNRRMRAPPPIHPPSSSIGSVAVNPRACSAPGFMRSPAGFDYNADHDDGQYPEELLDDEDSRTTEVEIDGSSCTLEEDDPPGGKKRKVPIPLVPGSEADVDSGRDGADRNPPRSAREDNGAVSSAGSPAFPVIRRLPQTPSAKLLASRRALFQKRKAGMVALYLDAQGAVESKDKTGTCTASSSPSKDTAADTAAPGPVPAGGAPTTTPLPDVGAFERLLPVLEDIDTWPPDAPGWRDGDDAAQPVPRRTLERWRTGFARRKRLRTERVPVVRGGWAPEGSFELDIPTFAVRHPKVAEIRRSAAEVPAAVVWPSVSGVLTKITTSAERLALTRLAEQLRALVLATNKVPSQPEVITQTQPPPVAAPPPAEPAGKKTGKKKKKKKRTTLANEGNPHHVDKYRPSRPVPVSDPYEPWPHHVSLLFPPPMKVLAARPGGKDVRPGEDDYICFSCQYKLFYGSEAQRKHAIKQRREELARREKLRARVYDVTHGSGSNRVRRHGSDGGSQDGEEDEDDYEDEEDDGEDGDEDDHCGSGHGRCTCGRALNDEPKPPDKPP